MYHPYFRGKQYELITIREMAPVMAAAGFIPIIEPVRETLSGLHKTLEAVVGEGGNAVVIVNPQHGEHSGDGRALTQLLNNEFSHPTISAGILLRDGMTADEALECYESHRVHTPVFIHAGFTEAKTLAQKLGKPRLSSGMYLPKRAAASCIKGTLPAPIGSCFAMVLSESAMQTISSSSHFLIYMRPIKMRECKVLATF
jgi:hypothetical protein